MKKSICYLAFLTSLLPSTIKAQELFTQISSDISGIHFNNTILESKNINSFIYEYLYNGGGVSVGDINNDGLPDLYFSGNMVANKLYLNLGNFKFKDITDSAGVGVEAGFKTGVTMADINADGYLDIYVCRSALADSSLRKNLLFINNKNGTFTNKAKEYGLADESYSVQAYFSDLDVDGDLDLFLLNHPRTMRNANSIQLSYNKKGELVAQNDTARTYVSYRYYENVNGNYKDKTIAAGLGTYAFGLSAIIDDFNNDGYPDIYTCNDYHEPDFLFINNKNGTFTNKANKFFDHFSYSSMGSDYADINNDGYLDLMVLDMLPESLQRQKQLRGPGNYDNFNKRVQYGFGYQYVKNVLQLNNGNQDYSDISYLAGVAFTDWSWAPLIADFDNDGNKDIYVTNGYLHDVTDMDFMVYKADSIKKELLKINDPKEAYELMLNIPSVKMLNYFYKNNGNLSFTNATLSSGFNIPSWSNGAAYCDLDNDGDLDLIVNNINDEPFIYKNNTIENQNGNFIRFKLIGSPKNTEGIGSSIQIETVDGKKQIQHFMPTKGFLSSHERFVHFGVGKNTTVNVTITWTENKTQTINNLNVNQVYTLDIANSNSVLKTEDKQRFIFKDITKNTGVKYTQKENSYIDFKLEPLLPHQFSKLGPCLAVADINGDKLEDFFIGGSKDHEGSVYVQDTSGKFKLLKEIQIIADKKYEDTGADFFDADNDGDQDLIVVSGGNEFPENEAMYPVRLYTNDGKGNFTKSSSLSNIFTSGKSIAIEDFDKDGDADLFIGGRVVPGHYGILPKSYLLQNNNGQFADITAKVPSLSKIGMITDGIWCDIDNDNWKELVIVGEWMPITIFKNREGKLDTTALIIENSNGWWNTIIQTDLNKDGLMDLVGGNYGINTRYRGSEQFPVTMTVSDFDNNGSTDCIISIYQSDGNSYPIVLRDHLLDQMNFLKKKYLRYSTYSNTTLTDIFSPEQLSNAEKFTANNMQSTVFINSGNGNFSQKYLPGKAQISPVNTMLADDIDKDGELDLLIAGNDYSTEVESGRNDAGIGLMLAGVGNSKFKSIPVTQSGWYLPGDVKCMKRININHKPCIIVVRNQGDVQFWGFTEQGE